MTRQERQPVHTVYIGAHLFRADIAPRFGALALQCLDDYADGPAAFAATIGLDGDEGLHETMWERVRAKLAREPVEDLRIDFEDGYGVRPDDEEDRCAAEAAAELARGSNEGTLPPFIGLRLKPLGGPSMRRALRTLDIFLSTLAARTSGHPPGRIFVTIPKVTHADQVTSAVDAIERSEERLGLEPGLLSLEIMAETTSAIVGPDGRCPLPGLLEAARGRCSGIAFGVYDYTASCGITAREQSLRHPACDFARHMMQVALAGKDVRLSDGATNVLPIPPRATVHRAWRLHFEDVRHSLRHAFYQGWDLDPAQLPTRYAAVFSFYLEGLDRAAERLRQVLQTAAQATLAGGVLDDAATAHALLGFFVRGLSSSALREDELTARGLTLDDLRRGLVSE